MAKVTNSAFYNTRSNIEYINSIKDVNINQYYVFAARPLPWSSPSTPDPILNTVRDIEYNIFDEMIFGKLITPDDVSFMAKRYDWVSNTVYAKYDHEDADLYNKNFYVVSQENGYHIFKCIDNANNAPSINAPKLSETSADENQYRTADGYIWKYMYSLDTQTYNKFTTSKYIPVIANPSVEFFAANGAIDNIVLVSGGDNYASIASGNFTQISVGNTTTHAVDPNATSSNNDFYNDCSIYIDSGPGQGQIRKIVDYIVTPTQHQVVIETPFTITPTLTSHMIISPSVNIKGDGIGASAFSVVNTDIKTIDRFEIISSGTGYTYADISVVGNTGTVQTNSAVARAIISPRGGHGANVYTELDASKVGISVTFSNNESNTISTTNEYARIGILKNPELYNVVIGVSGLTGTFISGETIVQKSTSNTSVNSINTTLTQYAYNVGDYVQLNFTAATSLQANDSIYQETNPSANATVIRVVGNTATVRVDDGIFLAGSKVVKYGALSVNNNINTITSGFTNTVYGLDNSNTLFSKTDSNGLDLYINNTKIIPRRLVPSNTTMRNFSSNNTTIIFDNVTLSNTDVISIRKYTTNEVFTSKEVYVYGVISSSNSTHVTISSASGMFTPNTSIQGLTSGATANIANVSSQFNVFNQTHKITGTPITGNFTYDDYCKQDTPGVDGAYGYVQNLVYDNGSGKYIYYLTNVKGVFESGANKYISSQDGSVVVRVDNVELPDLVRYTGDIVYVENIQPVTRSNTQSETIKIVINYT